MTNGNEVTRDRKYGICAVCQRFGENLESPGGSWWAHQLHPADGHDFLLTAKPSDDAIEADHEGGEPLVSDEPKPCRASYKDKPCVKPRGHRYSDFGKMNHRTADGIEFKGGVRTPATLPEVDNGYRSEADYQTWDRPPMSMRG